jgi:hypothetical protein
MVTGLVAMLLAGATFGLTGAAQAAPVAMTNALKALAKPGRLDRGIPSDSVAGRRPTRLPPRQSGARHPPGASTFRSARVSGWQDGLALFRQGPGRSRTLWHDLGKRASHSVASGNCPRSAPGASASGKLVQKTGPASQQADQAGADGGPCGVCQREYRVRQLKVATRRTF